MFDESLENVDVTVQNYLSEHWEDDDAKVSLLVYCGTIQADILDDLFPEPGDRDAMHCAIDSLTGYIRDQLRPVDVVLACTDHD